MHVPYEKLKEHCGHDVELKEFIDWSTEQPIGIELRCAMKDCQHEEPLLDVQKDDVEPLERIAFEIKYTQANKFPWQVDYKQGYIDGLKRAQELSNNAN